MPKSFDESRRNFIRGSAAALFAACAPRLAKRPTKPVEFSIPGHKKLKVMFVFGPHGTAKDVEPLGQALRDFKPHVVCPESAFESGGESANKKENEFYVHSASTEGDEFETALRKELAKQKPRIFLLERFQSRVANTARWDEHMREALYVKVLNHFFVGRAPAQTLDGYRSYLKSLAGAQVEREKRIELFLSDFHRALTKRFPELASEKEIRVVINYGTSHTPIFKFSRSLGFGRVERRMHTKPVYYFPSNVYVRRVTFGLNAENQLFSDEDVARYFLGSLLAHHASEVGSNLDNASAFGNLLSRKLSLQHYNNISSFFAGTRAHTEEERKNALVAAFAREGISLPSSKEGVHDFLKRRGIRLAPD